MTLAAPLRFCFLTVCCAAAMPAPVRAELFFCVDNGRLAIRQQPAGSCTRIIAPTSRRDAKPRRSEDRDRAPTPSADAAAPSLRAAQQRLRELGYRPGPADGIDGPRTRRAIRAFQRDAGLAVTGRADPALTAALRRAR